VSNNKASNYILNEQIGYLLRKATQRHTGIFSNEMFAELTTTRFAAMAKLYEMGSVSQNELGRKTAMDIATIKGVVDRARDRGFVETQRDPNDGRRQLVSLTKAGEKLVVKAIAVAEQVTEKTLKPLTKQEAKLLTSLLKKIS
jgi:DNA-binding MarR family transcriptional regulator